MTTLNLNNLLFVYRLDQELPCKLVTKEIETIKEENVSVVTANPTTKLNAKAANKKPSKLTDFFPTRRSVRKTHKEIQYEILKSYEKAVLEKSEDGLAVKHFDEKGRGVVATRAFTKGEFVIEYEGDLISMTEANKREAKYAENANTGCYMYYFKHNEQQYW